MSCYVNAGFAIYADVVDVAVNFGEGSEATSKDSKNHPLKYIRLAKWFSPQWPDLLVDSKVDCK